MKTCLNTMTMTLFLIFMYSNQIAIAQENETKNPRLVKIENVKSKLQLKLLLSKDQLIKLDSILKQYIPENVTDDNIEEIEHQINPKVEGLLTKKQKNKFEILKSTWLDELIDTSDVKE